jgi:rhodanese-related sulfurtransferase
VPQEEIAGAGESLKRFKDKVVITCCESGMRSGAAARVLQAQGFTKVVNLRGGLQAWRADSLPLVKGDGRGK